MSEAVLYGIPNCDTVRRARRWLDGARRAYRFHDVREAGLDAALLAQWCAQLGWEALVNRRSTTWRGLDESQRAGLGDAAAAIALLREHPTLLRRPVLSVGGRVHVGFDADAYRTLLAA